MTLLLPLALLIALAIVCVGYAVIGEICDLWPTYPRRTVFVGSFIIAGLLGLEAAVLQTIVGRF